MPSQLKSETARINGAKSRGPKTAEGREKSSRNSVTHGLTGRNIVVLECENQDDFWAVHAEQMEIHQPATPAEKDLVEQMVSARWRLRRIRSIESALLDGEMIRQKEAIAEKFAHCDTGVQLAEAYTTQANQSRAMSLVSRYETRLHRMYHSSYKVLRELQAARTRQTTQPAAPEPTQPEPAIVRQPPQKNSQNEPSSASPEERKTAESPVKNRLTEQGSMDPARLQIPTHF